MAKVVNAYIVYPWPKIPLNNFKLRNCLFGATDVGKNCEKEKWVHSNFEIEFDKARSWDFGNGNARNTVISCKNNFLVLLVEGPTYGITRSFDAQKKFSINFSKRRTKLCCELKLQ